MTCAKSAHTLHTILRGCCGTSCACPLSAAFSAVKYCECNDTVQNNTESYATYICTRLGGITGDTFLGLTGLNTYLTSIGLTGATGPVTGPTGGNGLLDFSIINCIIPIYLVADGATAATQIGTINFGTYVPISPVPTLSPSTGLYHIFAQSLSTSCATITIA